MNLSSKTTFSNGSITNLPSGDTLAYDCEGNLACVSNTVSGAVSLYWYDQHGRRIAKQENGLLTLYIWDGMDIIATAHADGTLREYYTRGIGIAGDVGSLVAETRFSGGTATTTYLHSNWRGDVVMATDTAGNVVGEYAYTTFGEQLSATGTYTPRFTFSSKERDASGLVYHGFRYYSPVLCRWISEDPIRESGGFNLYQFCWNNPVNYTDPWGLRFASQDEAAKAGIDNLYTTQPNADKWEYAFDIYRKPDGTYDYGPYHTDELPTRVNGVLFILGIDSGQYETKDCKGNYQPFEGNVHTHRREPAEPSEVPDNIIIPDLSRSTGKPFYIGNRWGDVNKFNPQKGKTGGWEWIRREK